MPRQTARLPLLSTSAPRREGPSPRTASPAAARVVAVSLVAVSLALITVYFRESSGGILHGAQRIGVSVVAPFEVAAERVARPFRDASGYVADVFQAKSENAKLREQIKDLRRQAVENEIAAQENEQLRDLLDFRDGPRFPGNFRPVATRVIAEPLSVFRQEVMVAAGSSDGIRANDPVVTEQGLVGTVTDVTSNAAKVRLLTDPQSAASALVPRTRASGIVLHGPSENSLILDRVPKDELVEKGDVVVTAGTRFGDYQSLYPRGITVGVVTGVSQRDVDFYKRIQVAPLVDFEALEEVIVLVTKAGSR